MPKVSVLTPLYNTNPEHLRMMIESVLNQTYKDFELLLLNDSPSNTELEKIVKSYNDDRIKYFVNEKNVGISASRNKLISLSKGEYIAIFDHDDISLPQRLEKEVKYLDENPKIGVVSCNFQSMVLNRKSHFPESNIEIKRELVVRGCVVLHTGSMIRKSVLIDNNIKYEEEYSPCEDYMLWGRLIEKTMFHNLQEVLIKYRDHENNTSHVQSEKMEDMETSIKNVLFKEYPYLASNYSHKSTIYFLGIPIIRRKKRGNKTYYNLFGCVPIVKTVR